MRGPMSLDSALRALQLCKNLSPHKGDTALYVNEMGSNAEDRPVFDIELKQDSDDAVVVVQVAMRPAPLFFIDVRRTFRLAMMILGIGLLVAVVSVAQSYADPAYRIAFTCCQLALVGVQAFLLRRVIHGAPRAFVPKGRN